MNANEPLTLGFSPCPNDCFIFDAMIHHKIDTEGLEFKVEMEDVETLNQKAFQNKLNITKLSYHAYAHLTNSYQLLNSGSALGNNCGPLLITNKNPEHILASLQNTNTTNNEILRIANTKSNICQPEPVEGQQPTINNSELRTPNSELKHSDSELKIAIPGKYTTANFLFSLAFPNVKNKVEMVFSDIEDAVLQGKVDAGLIIHENRFTYEQKGLKKVIDLGEYWENLTQMPIPLGGIVIQRNFPYELKNKIDRIIRRSVEYAFSKPDASRDFVRANAQEMSEEVMYKHIQLYVNDYSVALGSKGKQAVQLLFNKAQELKVIDKIEQEIFL